MTAKSPSTCDQRTAGDDPVRPLRRSKFSVFSFQLSVLALLLSLSGCCSVAYYLLPAYCYERLCPPPKPPPNGRGDEDGPGKDRVLSKSQILEILNERARKTTIFISRDVKVRAKLIKRGVHEMEGTAAIERPRNLRLLMEAPGNEMWAGSDNEQFWLYSSFDEGGRPLAGRWKHVGKPCAGRLALDPTSIFILLGLAELDERDGPITLTHPLGRKPDPAAPAGLSFEPNNFGYYVLQFHRFRDPTRPGLGLFTDRELWLTRNSVTPVLFIQYGPDGREFVRAQMGDYYEADGRLIPKTLFVNTVIYDASRTFLEGVEQFEFKLGEFAFELGMIDPKVFRGGFDPTNVPGWNGRRLIDADCDGPARPVVGPMPGG